MDARHSHPRVTLCSEAVMMACILADLNAMTYRTAVVFLAVTIIAGCGTHKGYVRKPAVRLVTTRGSLLNMAVYIGKALGYYDQEGVSVSLDEVASAPKTMQSVVGGSSDVATGGFMSVVGM